MEEIKRLANDLVASVYRLDDKCLSLKYRGANVDEILDVFGSYYDYLEDMFLKIDEERLSDSKR